MTPRGAQGAEITITAPKTEGQHLTDTLRRYFSIGTRTRRYRTTHGIESDLHADMIEALHLASAMPGYYTERTEQALRPAWGVYHSWIKHVEGHRIDPVLRYRITSMTPYQFAALLGRMVDAGVTNCGEGEQFFADMAREVVR